jgi:hypothetical protein
MNALVGDDVSVSVLAMRMTNVVLAVCLFTALWLLAARDQQRLLVLSVLGSLVPLGLFITSSVNPSAWAYTGVTVAWLGMLWLLIAERRALVTLSTIVFLAGAAMAITSRADSAAYLVVAVITPLVLQGRASLVRRGRLVIPGLASVWAIVVFLDARQSSALTSGLVGASGDGRALAPVLFYNLTELPGLVVGVFGAGPLGLLGWLDTPVPAVTWVSAIAVASGLAFIGLAVMPERKVRAFILVLGVMLSLPLIVLMAGMNLVGENVQPRYLLPLLPLLLGVLLTGRTVRETLNLTRGQTWVAFILLSCANSIALHANIRRYTTGTDLFGFNIGLEAEWWWESAPHPMAIWIIGTAAFAAVASTLFTIGSSTSREQVGQANVA